MWVVKVGGDDGELRPWHYIYVYSIESRLTMHHVVKNTPDGTKGVVTGSWSGLAARMTKSAVFSMGGRVVGLCWAKSKPQGPAELIMATTTTPPTECEHGVLLGGLRKSRQGSFGGWCVNKFAPHTVVNLNA